MVDKQTNTLRRSEESDSSDSSNDDTMPDGLGRDVTVASSAGGGGGGTGSLGGGGWRSGGAGSGGLGGTSGGRGLRGERSGGLASDLRLDGRGEFAGHAVETVRQNSVRSEGRPDRSMVSTRT